MRLEDGTDFSSRNIAASPQAVFDAFTDPSQLVRWLPPVGMTGRFESFDMNSRGSYRLVLTRTDGSGGGKTSESDDVVEAEIVTVEPGRKVVQKIEFESDDPANAGVMTMSWEVEPSGSGSRVTIRAENPPASISAEDHDIGLNSSLENLERLLTA